MIYIVLNLTMALFMVGFSFYTDRQTKEVVSNPLIPMNLFIAASCAFMALALWANINAQDQLILLFTRLSLFFIAMYSVNFCIYCILFPSYERPLLANLIKWGSYVLLAWFTFTKITGVTITDFIGFRVEADPLFSGRLTNYFPFTWYDFFKTGIIFVLPCLAAIIMLLRAENKEDRLNTQKSVMNAVSLGFGIVSIILIGKAAGRVPMFTTLTLFGVGVTQVTLVHSAFQNFLYDLKYIFGVFVTFALSYLIPAMLIGFVFPRLWPLMAKSKPQFFIYMALSLAVAITISYQISKFLSRKNYFRSFQYAESFEQELAKLDYSGEPEEIVHNLQNIFIHEIGMSHINILLDDGEFLESIYDMPGTEPVKIPSKNKIFDSLLNQNKNVVLKSVVENSHGLDSDKKQILDFFEETGCDAFILLAEGRRLIGAILLGPKAGGNIYADYDAVTFTKFYSYLFVFGYYMKNIANQSIVGTVNREIKMSAQIIESIQENMDPVKNPKYDTGYTMEHAHNIGGEFVDLIRLTDERHIFVLGDLSGKGISASMSMVIIKSIIRTYLAETRDFKLLVEKVNQFIRFNLPKGTFFEGIFGLIDFSDDTLYYINCGVPALFLYTRSYNNVIEIQGDGRVLGFVKDISGLIKVKKVKLNPGDIIVSCTDGLIDSKSLRGEVYGKERIQKSITEGTAQSADRIAKSIYGSCINFLNKGLDDDVSIFVLKRLSK